MSAGAGMLLPCHVYCSQLLPAARAALTKASLGQTLQGRITVRHVNATGCMYWNLFCTTAQYLPAQQQQSHQHSSRQLWSRRSITRFIKSGNPTRIVCKLHGLGLCLSAAGPRPLRDLSSKLLPLAIMHTRPADPLSG